MSLNRHLIIYVYCNSDFCQATSYNLRNFEIKCHPLSSKVSDLRFFDEIQATFNPNDIRAFALNVDCNDFSSFAENYKVLIRCRDFCQKYDVFFYLSNSVLLDAVSALTQTETMIKEGEKISIIVLISANNEPSYITLIREKNSYKIFEWGYPEAQSFTLEWKDEIIVKHKPAKVIVMYQKHLDILEYFEAMKNFLQFHHPTFQPIFVNSENYSKISSIMVDKILHVMAEKINKYDVECLCMMKYQICIGGKLLFETTFMDNAPFEKSVIIDVNPKKSITLSGAAAVYNPFELIEEIKMSTFKSKKIVVTLKLDINSFYDFKVEPFDENILAENLSNMNIIDKSAIVPDKVQMVFDKNYFSVSFYANGKEYKLNDADGSNKTPIYIEFTEEKPIIGKCALEIFNEKPNFVVFDLIKLCSISSSEVFNPKWGFRLSKENGDILVTMQTKDGEKQSTPEFLLALILKNGIHRIKEEIGKKMKKIEIAFDGFNPNETLKKNFVEAGKLLKTDIVFA